MRTEAIEDDVRPCDVIVRFVLSNAKGTFGRPSVSMKYVFDSHLNLFPATNRLAPRCCRRYVVSC